MTDTSLTYDLRHRDNSKTAQLFAKADRVNERELHNLKWFDYRFMSPMAATLKFREEFQKAYRLKYASNIDTEESHTKFGVRRGAPEDHRAEFTSLWRARQFADLFGAPYDVFLSAALGILLRGSFHRIPYVNQLYGKHRERVAAEVRDRWEKHCTARFMYSALPQYQQASFFGLAAQTAHRIWVIEQIKAFRSNSALLGEACYSLRILPEEQARAAFGQERLDMARATVTADATTSSPHTSCRLRNSLPSCAILPGAMAPGSIECSECKLSSLCARGEASVLKAVFRATGVSDPVEHREREKGRRRTQMSRAKTRSAAAAAAGLSRSA